MLVSPRHSDHQLAILTRLQPAFKPLLSKPRYTLSAGLYQAMGDKAAYTRQVGFSALQNEQLVLNYVRQHGEIRRADVMELCRVSKDHARDLIRRLKDRGALTQHGERRGAYYTIGPAATE